MLNRGALLARGATGAALIPDNFTWDTFISVLNDITDGISNNVATNAAFSDNNRVLLTNPFFPTFNGTVSFFDLDGSGNLTEVNTFAGGNGEFFGGTPAISSNGNFAAATNTIAEIIIFTFNTGTGMWENVVSTIPPTAGPSNAIRNLSFSQDGTILAVPNFNVTNIYTFNGVAYEILRQIVTSEFEGGALSDDGNWFVATKNRDLNQLLIFELTATALELRQTINVPLTGGDIIRAPYLTNDAEFVYVGTRDNLVFVYTKASPTSWVLDDTLDPEPDPRVNGINSLSASRQGANLFFITQSNDGSGSKLRYRIFNLESGSYVLKVGPNDEGNIVNTMSRSGEWSGTSDAGFAGVNILKATS